MHLAKFSLERTIHDIKNESVFELFSNFENYQKLFPQHFPSVRIRSIRGNTSVVEQHLNLGGRELLIMAKHVSKKPVLHDVFVIGGQIKGSHIREEFVKLDTGTKVLVDVDLKLKGISEIIHAQLKKNTVKDDYAKILDDFILSLK